MDRNPTRIGLLNFLILLVTGALGFYLARQVGSLGGQVGMAFVATGVVVTLLSWFQMRLEERERLEKLELEELSRTAKGSTLFDTGDSEIYPAQRAREQFERFIVPAGTVLLLLLQAGGAAGLWIWLDREVAAEPPQNPMFLMAMFGLFALVLLLLGKYGVKLAQLQRQRLLRPGAAYVLLASAVCFVVALTLGAVQAGFPGADRLIARILVILLGLAGIETLVSLVFEVYRPRVRGRAPSRVIYDSRLVGLVGQPAGIFKTLAQALDYQFGFKVSDTWFYQFLQRSAGWILLGQAGVLLLFTCFVFIEEGEEAILERNGAPVEERAILGPGLHFKLPWPIDRVYRERTRQLRSLLIGIVEDEEDSERPRTILWTQSHAQEEYNLLVASRAAAGTAGEDQAPPVNLISVNIPVQYQITNLLDWATRHANPTNMLELVASRETASYLASVDFFEFMSTGREQAAEDLRRRMQAAANELRLGVEILFVGLQGVHPPVSVGKDFNQVVAAFQEQAAAIEHARAYALTNVILARAEATNRVRQAEVYRARQVAGTYAQAAQFTNQLKAFLASPEVYSQRAYLRALTRGVADARKIVVATTNAQGVFNLNLEERLRPDLLDTPLVGDND